MLIQLKNQNTFNIVNYVIIHLAAMLAAILIFIIILNIYLVRAFQIDALTAKYSAQNKFKSYLHLEYIKMVDDEKCIISQILK